MLMSFVRDAVDDDNDAFVDSAAIRTFNECKMNNDDLHNLPTQELFYISRKCTTIVNSLHSLSRITNLYHISIGFISLDLSLIHI